MLWVTIANDRRRLLCAVQPKRRISDQAFAGALI